MTMPGMGGDNRTVNVTVNAKIDPYQKAMGDMQKATLAAVNALDKLDQKIMSVGKNLGKILAGAGAGGIAASIGAAGKAANLHAAFAPVAANLSLTSGNPATEMDKIIHSAKNLSQELPIATANFGALMAQVKSLGVEGVRNISELTVVSARLAAATNTAPGQLFAGLANLTRTMGNDVVTIERYGSALVALSAKTGANANDVLNFANSIQAVGDKAGISETQILALATSFERAGADGVGGATAFNTVIADMSRALEMNSSRLDSYANLLGVTRDRFAELAKSNPAEAFVQFVESIQKQGPQSTRILEEFGLDGIRTQRTFAALTSGAGDLRGAMGTANSAFSDGTAVQKASQAAWDGLNEKVQMFRNSIANIVTEVGEPLATLFGGMVDGFTKVGNIIGWVVEKWNSMPGIFGDTITAILSKGAALAAFGGTFIALAFGATKFLSIFRVLRTEMGRSITGGFLGGIRGNPYQAAEEGASRTRMALAQGAYNVGSGMRGTTNLTGERSLLGKVAMFPASRVRQIFTGSSDTMRSMVTGRAIDPTKTDPYSGQGAYQWLDKGARNLGGRMGLDFTPSEEATQQWQRKEARLATTSKAATRAYEQQMHAIRIMPISQQRALLEETNLSNLAQDPRYKYTPVANMTDRQVRSNMGLAASRSAGLAEEASGRLFDERNPVVDTAHNKALAPFEKLAAGVKTTMGTITTGVTEATTQSLGAIETFFGKAMERISALAKAAQMQGAETAAYLSELASGGGVGRAGQPTYGPPPSPYPPNDPRINHGEPPPVENRMSRMPVVPPTVMPYSAAAPKPVVPPSGPIWSGAHPDVNPLGPGGRPLIGQTEAETERISREQVWRQGAKGRGEMGLGQSGDPGIAAAARLSGQKIGLGANVIASNLVKAGSKIGGALKDMAHFFMGPLGLLTIIAGPFILDLIGKLGNHRMEDTSRFAGAELQGALGRDFKSPAELAKARSDEARAARDAKPFSEVENRQAMGTDFADKYGNTLTALSDMVGTQAKTARLQEEINRIVQSQSGTPLDDPQREQIRMLATASMGSTVARDVVSQLQWGGSGGGSATGMTNAFRTDYLPQAFSSYRQTGNGLADIGTNTAAQYSLTPEQGGGAQGLANALKTGQQDLSSGEFARYVNTTLKEINAQRTDQGLAPVQDYAHAGGGIGDWVQEHLGGFFGTSNQQLTDMGAGPQNMQQFIDGLKAAGGASANLAQELITAGALLPQFSQDQIDIQNEAGARLRPTRANELYGQRHGTGDGQNILDVFSQPESVDFQKGIQEVLVLLGQIGGQTSGQLSTAGMGGGGQVEQNAIEQRLALLRDARNKQQDPQSDTYKSLQAVIVEQQGRLTQIRQTQDTPGQNLVASAKDLNAIDTSNPNNYNEFLDARAQVNADTGTQVNTLRQYMIQVDDTYRAMARAADDYSTSVSNSNRDFNIQQKESLYQRNNQLRIANYQFSEQQRMALYQYHEAIRSMKYETANAWGSPGAFVQSTYTQSASTSTIGMDRQIDYLKRSLAGLGQARDLGVSNDVIKLFGLDDPKNFQQLEQYIHDWIANPELVATFNKQVQEQLNISEALANDPSNSRTNELNRQFDNAAMEAQRAFDNSMTESTMAYDHASQMTIDAFARSMSDQATAYNLSVTRTLEDLGRLGMDLMTNEEQLFADAAASGIAGIEALALQIQEAIDLVDSANTRWLGKNPPVTDNSAGHNSTHEESYGNWNGDRRGTGGGFPEPSIPYGNDNQAPPANTSNYPAGAHGFYNTNDVKEYRTYGANMAKEHQIQILNFTSAEKANYKNEASVTQSFYSSSTGTTKTHTSDLYKIHKSFYSSDLESTKSYLKELTSLFDYAWGAIKTGTVNLMDGLGKIWSSLPSVLSGPIHEFTGTVLNQWVLGNLNQVLASLQAPLVPLLQGKFHEGGDVPGVGDGDKVHLMAEPGEFIVRKREANKPGVREHLKSINDGRMDMQYFAEGGTVLDALTSIVKTNFPDMRMTSGYRPGDPGYHGSYRAGDFAGAKPYPDSSGMSRMLELDKWIATNYGNSTELIHTASGAINLYHGAPHTYSASTQSEHKNHVHWAMEALDMLSHSGKFTAAPGGTGTGETATAMLARLFAPLPAKIAELFPGQGMATILRYASDKVMKSAETYAQKMEEKAAPKFDSSAGADQWAPMVSQVLTELHLTQQAVGGIVHLIDMESGGNPNAINLWDSNAKAGHPSQGLMQTIPSTFNAYAGPYKTRPITDPYANIYAGTNYANQTYGIDMLVAGGRKDSSGHYIGYANGGVFDRATNIKVGEGGPETVLPLNGVGADFVAKILKASMNNMGFNPGELRSQHTRSCATPAPVLNISNTYDHSTEFSGPITVVAQDPNEMARRLAERKRLEKLKNGNRVTANV